MNEIKLDKKTQTNELIKYLKKHKQITEIEARNKLGIHRLSARIYDLRYIHDMNIRSESKTVKTRYGSTTNIAVYHLIEDEYIICQECGELTNERHMIDTDSCFMLNGGIGKVCPDCHRDSR